MLLSVHIDTKTIGNKTLFEGLDFTIEAREKVAIIGRNGAGKTTLFNMLAGTDQDYYGTVHVRRGTRLVTTAQEHHGIGDQSPLTYILNRLPDYSRLKHIIDTYPDTMGEDLRKIQTYTEALEHFSSLGYYTIEDNILLSLMEYQIDEAKARAPMSRLSGGQKRFVELVRIEHSHAELALIDEPTNHMDYAAKQSFIDWLKAVKHAVVVISHDRDVLQHVDRIIEIKDHHAQIFKGNYKAYLKQNAAATAAGMQSYEVGLQTLANLNKQVQAVRAKKASTSKTPNPFIPLEKRLLKQRDELEAQLQKPNFWIDRESAGTMHKKVQDNYTKYKTKNIRVHTQELDEGSQELLRLENVQLGYGAEPLFAPLNFSLGHGDRIQLVGRNGAGKTTLIRAITDIIAGQKPVTWRAGNISASSKTRLSVYEQEIDATLLPLTLQAAIEHIYREHALSISTQHIMNIMGSYLFNPHEDAALPVANLSGGQKARLQIIKMLANNPNLLILDEPTNHLDLPSIEELENALADYQGAILFVSHDSYFATHIGGSQQQIVPA